MARPKGSQNKVTRAFKEATLHVFNERGLTAFRKWADNNETEFYKICARLIPHEVIGPGAGGEHIVKTIVHEHHSA